MVHEFCDRYIEALKSKLDQIDRDVFAQVVEQLERCEKSGASVYLIGNGGSAATASHMQNDLGAGLLRRGILNLNIISLVDNVAVLSAMANDVGYENIFYNQIRNRVKAEDLLIAISCSGNSPNIVKAAEYAKQCGATIVGLTGFDGGKLKVLSDIRWHVESEVGEYGVVEDMHMIFNHMLYTYYIEKNSDE